jgi:transcriptional regulator with XRE-family HTH domain
MISAAGKAQIPIAATLPLPLQRVLPAVRQSGTSLVSVRTVHVSFSASLLAPDRHHIRGTALPKTKANQSTEFGQRLKQLREARSLNVAEFAKRIQASPAAIWHWEHRGTLPRIGALNAIAEVLGVPRSFLETGKSVDGGNEIGGLLSGGVPSAATQMSLEQLMKAIEAKGFDVCVRSKAGPQS